VKQKPSAPGTYFSGAAESTARHLLRTESRVTDIASAWLLDHDLSGLGKDYGRDLASEPPICERDASADSPPLRLTRRRRSEGQNDRPNRERLRCDARVYEDLTRQDKGDARPVEAGRRQLMKRFTKLESGLRVCERN
jgi:hypothetical protein